MAPPGHDDVCVLVSCVADHTATTLDTLATLTLAENELVRAAGIVAPSVRRAYILAHALKRIALGLAIQALPLELVFTRDPLGKAHLPGTGLHFNLSHSGAFVALAFSGDGPVGVDIEARRAFETYRHAAAASLCEQEMATVRESADPASVFLKIWTAKEAYVKASGEGLRKSFRELLVTCSDTGCIVGGETVHANKTFLHIDAAYVLCACSFAQPEQKFFMWRVCLSAEGELCTSNR